MTDPIADMLTRIRNAQCASHRIVAMPCSSIKKEIARVLLEEGYIAGYNEVQKSPQSVLEIELKYFDGKPVIEEIDRISKSGLRKYSKVADLPKKRGGLGIYILSTSRGVMSDHQARRIGQGGELICAIA